MRRLLLLACFAATAAAWRFGAECWDKDYCCVDGKAFCLDHTVMKCPAGTFCQTPPDHATSPCVSHSSHEPVPCKGDLCEPVVCDNEEDCEGYPVKQAAAVEEEEEEVQTMDTMWEEEEEVVEEEEEVVTAEAVDEVECEHDDCDHEHHHHHHMWKQGDQCHDDNYCCVDGHHFCLGGQAMRCADGTVCVTQKNEKTSPCVWP